MVQKKFDVSLIEKSVKDNPNVKNKLLYELSNAITDNQKTIVRKKKAKLKKVQIPPGEKSSGRKKLTEEYIEKLICDGLDANPGNAQLIGKATDFYLKISSKKEILDDDLDMELLKKIGIKISDSE